MTEERTHDAIVAARRLDADPDDVPAIVTAPPTAHPLGPRFEFRAPHRQARARVWSGLILTGCVGVLSVAAWVSPDPSGLGSHRQLGLPACAAVMLTGYPCPTCGMTTAFAHTVRGQFVSAFSAQPAGLLLAIGTMAAGILSVFVLLSGYVPSVNWYRVSPAWVVLIVAAVILLGWLYKLTSGPMTGPPPIR